MMLVKKYIYILLTAGSIGILNSCSSVQTSDGHYNSATSAFQKPPIDQASSQERLGLDYLLGRGVPENSAQAFYWFKKAAEQGSSLAANELGYMYTSGKGVVQDYQLALKWYQKAAADGLASAQYNLGLMYAHGLGTTVDKAKAEAYFQQASAQGFAPAKKSNFSKTGGKF